MRFFPARTTMGSVARRDQVAADGLWVEEFALGLLGGSKFDEAEAQARHAIRNDLFRERAWQLLLRSLPMQGRRADMIKTYRTMHGGALRSRAWHRAGCRNAATNRIAAITWG